MELRGCITITGLVYAKGRDVDATGVIPASRGVARRTQGVCKLALRNVLHENSNCVDSRGATSSACDVEAGGAGSLCDRDDGEEDYSNGFARYGLFLLRTDGGEQGSDSSDGGESRAHNVLVSLSECEALPGAVA